MCVFANRENIGSVDHPEHHARARPNWNGGQELVVRLGAMANKKERRNYPHFLLVEFFGAKGDDAARSSPDLLALTHRLTWSHREPVAISDSRGGMAGCSVCLTIICADDPPAGVDSAA
jgi:hypothetical protein